MYRHIRHRIAAALIALGLAGSLAPLVNAAPTSALKAPPFGALKAAPTLKAPPFSALKAAPTLKAPPFV